MAEEKEIVNRVANSGLITLDPADFYIQGERALYDIRQNLFMELILKEKEFREFIKTFDWSLYEQKHVAITCSTDAIIPAWAYMLLVSKLQPFAKSLFFGDLIQLETYLYMEALNKIDFSVYQNQKVVVKGCGDLPIPNAVYLEITKRLIPYTNTIMYGEPCSTVPVYKRGK